MAIPPERLQEKPKIEFSDEVGIDCGGLLR